MAKPPDMPEQPKLVVIGKWRPRGSKIVHIEWTTIIESLKKAGKIKETEEVDALFAYTNGVTFDLK